MLQRGLFVWACGSGVFAAILALSCGADLRPAGDAGVTVPPADAGADVSDAAEASTAPSPEDPCGFPSGVAPGAPWPMAGACARRPSSRKELRGPSSGSASLTYALTGRATSPIVAEDGTVIVGTSDAHVVAITAAGQKRWDVTAAGPVTSSPVLTAGGEVTFVTAQGRLAKLAIADGAELGARDGANGASGLLPLADGTLVYAATDGKAHRINLSDLVETSTIDVDTQEALTLARDGALLASGRDGVLRRVGTDGAVTELYRAGVALVAPPIVTVFGDVVVVGRDEKLRSVKATGELRFERPLGGALRGVPAASPDGSVYAATTAGKVVGFDRDGKELFAFAPLGLAESPVVAGSGTVFFGAEDTKLYAVMPSGRLLFSGSLKAKALSAGAFAQSGAFYVAVEGGVAFVGP